MKIATWNVNSVRSRLERLLAWLEKAQPDILCLQELKCTEDAFPYEAIQKAGYHSIVCGQKTYNGVAILSRIKPSLIERGMDDGEEDHRIGAGKPNKTGPIRPRRHCTRLLKWAIPRGCSSRVVLHAA